MSRYIREIRDEDAAFSTGQRIRHKKYGEGTVICVCDGKISLQFDQLHHKKTFSLAFLLEQNLLEIIADKRLPGDHKTQWTGECGRSLRRKV